MEDVRLVFDLMGIPTFLNFCKIEHRSKIQTITNILKKYSQVNICIKIVLDFITSQFFHHKIGINELMLVKHLQDE